MNLRNTDGIIPEQLTTEELTREISFINDFAVMADCLDYLSEKEPELVADIMENMVTADQNAENYGTAYYQAMFLGELFSLRPQKAIDFALANYDKVERYVLKTMVESVTYVDGKEFNELRQVLKEFLESKDYDFFRELDVEINGRTYITTTREEFLKSFENEDQQAT